MTDEPLDNRVARELLQFLENFNLFGEHLELSMELLEVRGSHLADKLHVRPATVTQWKYGKRFPDSAMLYRIAQQLSMSPEERQSLRIAWTTTKTMRSYVGYLEEAIAENDHEVVKEILGLLDDSEM